MTLRRRLTLVLALAVGLSGIALAAGSYFLVRHNLLSDSVDSSIVQTRRNLVVAAAYPDTGDARRRLQEPRRLPHGRDPRRSHVLSSTGRSLRSVPAGPAGARRPRRARLRARRPSRATASWSPAPLPRTGRSSTSSSRRTTCGTSSRCCATSCSAASGSSSCSPRWPVSCSRAAPCGRLPGRARRRARSPRACSRRACRWRAGTSSAPGRSRSTRWPRRSRRRSRRFRLPRPASAASPPMSRTSCGRR